MGSRPRNCCGRGVCRGLKTDSSDANPGVRVRQTTLQRGFSHGDAAARARRTIEPARPPQQSRGRASTRVVYSGWILSTPLCVRAHPRDDRGGGSAAGTAAKESSWSVTISGGRALRALYYRVRYSVGAHVREGCVSAVERPIPIHRKTGKRHALPLAFRFSVYNDTRGLLYTLRPGFIYPPTASARRL